MLTITADRVDELPEALRSIAKEAGGKFQVSELPTGFAIENVHGLKTSLADERAARKAAEKRAGLIEGLGDEDVPAARAALEQLRAGSLKSNKDIEDHRKVLEEKFSGQLKAAELKTAKREAQLRKAMGDEWTRHLVEAGFGDALRLVMPICLGATAFEEDQTTGEVRTVLRDEHGKPLISKKPGNNDGMDKAEFVALLREQQDLKPLCKAKATGGSGAGSQSGGSGGPQNSKVDINKMSSAELMALGDRATA